MKTLLYIGNKLEGKGRSASTIDTLGPLLEAEGYKIRYASSSLNIFSRFSSMIYATLRYGKQSDFVLIDTYSTLNFYYAFFCSQICRILTLQYIPLLHGGDLPLRLKKSPQMSKMIFGNAYINIAPSSYLKNKFEEQGFQKIKIIPNNVVLTDFPYLHRDAIAPKLIWVRAMAEIYNPLMALLVLKNIQNVYPNATLTMVGPDKEEMLPTLINFAESEKLNVNFTGKLSRKEWGELSKSNSIFINTSNYDNMPVSLLEAAALGLLIISTDVGGISYIFKNNETALLSAANDVEEMAENIIKLLSQSKLQKTLQENTYKLIQQFDWNQVKEHWRRLFELRKPPC